MSTQPGAIEKEWLRTDPEVLVYIPHLPDGTDSQNQHLNATVTPGGAFLATWTCASVEAAPDQRAMISRSPDRGKSWTEPLCLDGATPDDPSGTGMASWQFPIPCPGVLPGGGSRIWCFYTKNIGISDARPADSGALRGRYSDDDGVTWSERTYDYPIGRSAISHPDPAVPPVWLVYQNPSITHEGHVIAGFTRCASDAIDPSPSMLERTSEICFLRFENILTEPDPDKLTVTTWPQSPHGLRVPHPQREGISVAQEPTVVRIPDGRLLCPFRTMTGMIYFSLSEDDGRTWSTPDVLRYEPGGDPVLNPLAPCPLYELQDGRYLLVFFNNDGSGHGGTGPTDASNVRNPAYITIGRAIPGHPHQPIRFGPPKIFASTDWFPAPGTVRTQVATYCSLVEADKEVWLFYPDRKTYLLAKHLGKEWLSGCDPEVAGSGPAGTSIQSA